MTMMSVGAAPIGDGGELVSGAKGVVDAQDAACPVDDLYQMLALAIE